MTPRRLLGVPEPDRTIAGTGRQAEAVRAESQREHIVRVSLQTGDLLAGRQVPQPDGPVAAARRQPRAVGMKDRREDRVGVPPQDGDASRRGHVPHSDRAIIARRGQEAPIAAERNGENDARMTHQPGRSLAPSRVPEIDLCAIFARACQEPPVRTIGQQLFDFGRGRPEGVDFRAGRGFHDLHGSIRVRCRELGPVGAHGNGRSNTYSRAA